MVIVMPLSLFGNCVPFSEPVKGNIHVSYKVTHPKVPEGHNLLN
ncbi:hypothetical protein VPHD292_0107 [Vibrio phage D292]